MSVLETLFTIVPKAERLCTVCDCPCLVPILDSGVFLSDFFFLFVPHIYRLNGVFCCSLL